MSTFSIYKHSVHTQVWSNILLAPTLFEAIGYDTGKAFDQLGCDTIYEGGSLLVAKEARVKGLGAELSKR